MKAKTSEARRLAQTRYLFTRGRAALSENRDARIGEIRALHYVHPFFSAKKRYVVPTNSASVRRSVPEILLQIVARQHNAARDIDELYHLIRLFDSVSTRAKRKVRRRLNSERRCMEDELLAQTRTHFCTNRNMPNCSDEQMEYLYYLCRSNLKFFFEPLCVLEDTALRATLIRMAETHLSGFVRNDIQGLQIVRLLAHGPMNARCMTEVEDSLFLLDAVAAQTSARVSREVVSVADSLLALYPDDTVICDAHRQAVSTANERL